MTPRTGWICLAVTHPWRRRMRHAQIARAIGLG
jgi:hypothetical protein